MRGQAQHVAVDLDEARLAEAPQVVGVLAAHVAPEACAVLGEVDAAAQQPEAEEDRFGARRVRVEFGALDDGAAAGFDQLDVARARRARSTSAERWPSKECAELPKP